MERKEVQTRRMKGYFIQAAKEILRGEGFRSISVRNIADRAGYSYATLYNYFKDLQALIFDCVSDFQDECTLFVSGKVQKTQQGVPRIKAIVRAYMQYFVQYPGIFELFFIEKLSDSGSRQSLMELIATHLDQLCSDAWDFCVQENRFSREDVGILRIQIRNMVTGQLLFYIHRRTPESYQECVEVMEKQINYLLDN
ncbi:TetR/AcrR family transcriptional regulator [bacterium]|nr:TetR/AcrR family transcriptional regulator [bacterium]